MDLISACTALDPRGKEEEKEPTASKLKAKC